MRHTSGTRAPMCKRTPGSEDVAIVISVKVGLPFNRRVPTRCFQRYSGLSYQTAFITRWTTRRTERMSKRASERASGVLRDRTFRKCETCSPYRGSRFGIGHSRNPPRHTGGSRFRPDASSRRAEVGEHGKCRPCAIP